MNKSHLKKLMPICLIAILIAGVYGSASALVGSKSKSTDRQSQVAMPHRSQQTTRLAQSDSGCVGLSCHGYNNGGYGNHQTGRRGSGGLAGYSLVRFDSFRPSPELRTCSNPDRATMAQLGLSGHDGPFFEHHRVGVLRSDNQTVVVGVGDALFYGQNIEINLNSSTIQTRPTNNPGHGPQSGWVGAGWLGRVHCLPLSGDEQVKNQLENERPTITILHKGNEIDFSEPDKDAAGNMILTQIRRLLLGTSDLVLRIEVSERSVTGDIPIEFKHIKEQIKINVGSLEEFFRYLEQDCQQVAGNLNCDVEKANEIWELSNTSDSAVFADVSKVQGVLITETSGERRYRYDVPLKVKKTGGYQINVDVNFQAFVGGDGVAFNGLSGVSETLYINAISSKPVNRR